MKFEDILTKYWSQITLLLLAIGYFIKHIYSLRETRHSLFQQNKINAISKFLTCYSEAENVWRDLPIYNIIHEKLTVKEMDNLIFPSMNNLKNTQVELHLYLNNIEIKPFEVIVDSLFKLNKKVSDIYFNTTPENKNIDSLNEYYFLKEEVIKNNRNALQEIGKTIRKKFHS